jgi:hypothetical protein
MPVMRVEGGEPLNPDLKGLESGALEPSRKGHVVLMVVLPGGVPRGVAPSEPSGHDHHSAPGKPLGLV